MSVAGDGHPHVLLALSAHGYGHLAQCAPVVNALSAGLPALQLSVCSTLPGPVIADRINVPFDARTVELDPVLQMHSAWEVDVPASQQVYRAFHDDWEQGLQRDRQLLHEFSPDVVLADIPYRILLAARQLGIPVIGLCSLNWAVIYSAYSENKDVDRRILEQMKSGYRAADTFLTPQPAMEMQQLHNTRAIGPIARKGKRRPAALREQCGLPVNSHVVLVALGGIMTRMPLSNWPRRDNTVWIFAHTVQSGRADIFALDELSMSFIDVLASADAVLTKPGYGTYTEAVCHGVGLLVLARPDWPETAVLNEWARSHGQLAVITKDKFNRGEFLSELASLLAMPPGPVPEPTGVAEAVAVLRDALPAA